MLAGASNDPAMQMHPFSWHNSSSVGNMYRAIVRSPENVFWIFCKVFTINVIVRFREIAFEAANSASSRTMVILSLCASD
jgi:hypothetical protein